MPSRTGIPIGIRCPGSLPRPDVSIARPATSQVRNGSSPVCRTEPKEISVACRSARLAAGSSSANAGWASDSRSTRTGWSPAATTFSAWKSLVSLTNEAGLGVIRPRRDRRSASHLTEVQVGASHRITSSVRTTS
jgi:hypothetical protein